MTALRYHTSKATPKRGPVLGMDREWRRFLILRRQPKGKDHARIS
jgi:hypothetical protein